jgi:hypothetical protein
LVRELEGATRPKDEQKKITIKQALDAFVSDCEARNLNRSTLGKYRSLRTKLVAYLGAAYDRSRCTADQIREFRQQRSIGARTAAKEVERLWAFFASVLTTVGLRSVPRNALKPCTRKAFPGCHSVKKQFKTCWRKPSMTANSPFLLTLRHTGLRIGDGSLVRVSQFSENRIYLYTSKAGTPVSVLVPDNLVLLLKTIQPRGGYFFSAANQHRCTPRRTFGGAGLRSCAMKRKCLPLIQPIPLAADLLSKGASVEDVAAVLGNSPAVVMKHYSQWIKSRQDRLGSVIAQTWTP